MGVINLGILIKKVMSKVAGAGYIKADSYASSTTGGTIKTDSTYATDITSGGKLKAKEITAEAYSEANDAAFISKATLDNVLATLGGGFTKETIWTGSQSLSAASTDTVLKDVNDYKMIGLLTDSSGVVVETVLGMYASEGTVTPFWFAANSNAQMTVCTCAITATTLTTRTGVGGSGMTLKAIYGYK